MKLRFAIEVLFVLLGTVALMADPHALARLTREEIGALSDDNLRQAYRKVRLNIGLPAVLNKRVELLGRIGLRRLRAFTRTFAQEAIVADRERLAQANPFAREHNQLTREFTPAIGVFDTADHVSLTHTMHMQQTKRSKYASRT